VTLNTLIKPDELDDAGRLLDQLGRQCDPTRSSCRTSAWRLWCGRPASRRGHLVTLANMSFPAALPLVQEKTADRQSRPSAGADRRRDQGHGGRLSAALGSRYLFTAPLLRRVGTVLLEQFSGGKSGLRGGACSVPKDLHQEGEGRRLFSCQDLNLDVLVKVLLAIPQIRAWKIEGRKKGPHYVYYTVAAYRMLRDHPGDPE